MEKTLEIQLAELRERIVEDIKSCCKALHGDKGCCEGPANVARTTWIKGVPIK